MASRKLQVEIIGDASSLQRAFGQAGRSSSRLSGGLRSLGKVAAVGVGAAFAGLAATLKVGFDEMAEGQKVSAQTGAVLKSTGQAANVTAKDIEGLAGSLSRMSGVDDEAIQSGENMLLTFTRIRNEVGKGNDIFDQATKATLNLSVAMGKDMQSSAILVGKALNDPIKGMSALSRAGIQFTEEQKKTIKGLVDTGHAMDAQKIILGELTTQFGGSAKAFGETMPGQLSKLKNSFEEMAGSIAQTLMPHLQTLLDWTNAHMPQIQRVIEVALQSVIAAIKFLTPIIAGVITAFQRLAEAAEKHWPRVKAAAESVMRWYKDNLEPTIISVSRNISRAWDRMGTDMQNSTKSHLTRLPPILSAQIQNIGSVVNVGLALLRGDWSKAWSEIKEIPVRTFRAIVSTVKTYIGILRGAGEAVGRAIVDGIRSGFTAAFDGLKAAVSNKISDLKNALKVWGSGPDEWAHKEIGMKIIEGIISGLAARDFAPAVRAKIDAAIDAAKSAIESRRGALGDAMGTLVSEALSAFDKLASGFETRTEKKIRKQDEARAKGERQGALASARADIAAAETPEQLAAALQREKDALFAIERAADEKLAALERKQRDDRTALRRRHFEEELAAAGNNLEKVLGVLKKYHIPMRNAGGKLGLALAEGLTDAVADVKKAIKKVAEEIADQLRRIKFVISVEVHGVNAGGAPGMATGGRVRRGRPYVVGEHRPELFVPDQSGRVLSSVPGGGSGMLENHTHVYLDSREIFTEIQRKSIRFQNSNATPAFQTPS